MITKWRTKWLSVVGGNRQVAIETEDGSQCLEPSVLEHVDIVVEILGRMTDRAYEVVKTPSVYYQLTRSLGEISKTLERVGDIHKDAAHNPGGVRHWFLLGELLHRGYYEVYTSIEAVNTKTFRITKPWGLQFTIRISDGKATTEGVDTHYLWRPVSCLTADVLICTLGNTEDDDALNEPLVTKEDTIETGFEIE